MNILITGSTGFIGSHLMNILDKQEGVKTWSYDKQYGNDILDYKHLREFVDMSDMVYHLAANKSVKELTNHYPITVDGTMNVLEAMRESKNCKTIVFASTSAVYGYVGENAIFSEDYDPPKPISMYAAAKAAAENLICGYCHSYGMKAVVFRIANVVGSGATGVVPDLLRKAKEDPSRLEILGDGQQRKSYIHAEDVARALTFVKPELPFEVYNLGNNDTITVNEIADMIAPQAEKVYKDSWLGDVHSYSLYNFKMRNKGWKLKYPTSKEAIKKVLEESGY